jgi:protein SCO1/2
VLAVTLLLSACSGGPGNEQTPTPTDRVHHIQGDIGEIAREKPEFVLQDIEGNEFDFRKETDGYVTLLYFGYTYCPDKCPSHMADLAAVIDKHPEIADRLKVVFVTVDPPRDTPDRLDLWLGLFNESFIGLTGTQDEIVQASKSALADEWFPPETATFGTDDYSVRHGAYVIAYGYDNTAQIIWPFGTRQATYEHDLLILTSQGDNNES